MPIFEDLNRACVEVFSDGESLTYNHLSGFSETLTGVFVDRVDEPSAPGPITRLSIVSADLSEDPSKRDTVWRENGCTYLVTEIHADGGGMTHLQLRKYT